MPGRALLCSCLLLAGCEASAPAEVGPDAPLDAGSIDAGSIDAGSIDADLPSLDFEHGWREGDLCAVEGGGEDCCAEGRVELPARAASVLDLRGLASGAAGTCGDPTKRALPSDRAAYPLMVLLPAIDAPDPLCETACAGRGRPTSFGVVLVLPDSLTNDYRPRVVAPAPWRYVYDHNSLEGDCCVDGYQEFGERVCVRPNYGGFIGFATSAPIAPVRAALIDLEEGENGAVDTCCPYLPDEP